MICLKVDNFLVGRSAIYANRRYLDSYKTNGGQQLVQNEPGKPEIVGECVNLIVLL